MLVHVPKWLVPWLMLLVVGIVAWPGLEMMVGGHPKDGFPLSNFPMFSRKSANPRSYTYVRAIDDDGRSKVVKHSVWAWGGMNQSIQLIHRLKGKSRMKKLCRRAAKRVAKMKSFRRYDTVEVVRDGYNVREYFGERQYQPARRRRLASCKIPRATTRLDLRRRDSHS